MPSCVINCNLPINKATEFYCTRSICDIDVSKTKNKKKSYKLHNIEFSVIYLMETKNTLQYIYLKLCIYMFNM